jgi:two-component system OmpR family sensor kinase
VIEADGDRLQQVLVNLVANAVRYGGDYRAVVARVERDDVVIEVHDNGPGVPPRFALRIWDRFERGPNRYNATAPGSGIGLAVVQAVTEAHGGSTSYERSTLLGGACFRLRLPLRRLIDDAPGYRAAASSSDWSAA